MTRTIRRYHIEITPRALRDLKAIASYINKKSPLSAARIVTDLRDEAMKLDHMPLRGAVAPEGIVDGALTHQRVVGKYRILYTVEGRTVYIVGFRHARRRLMGQ